ncbi:MAG: hypothetical protein LBF67_08150 [Prevotellaceae bacterium]|jgi:energy-coupling factor transporter transmembrane protein EcfT|nr:hypothetical protein [Prevotellaceae bacterium]
MKKEEYRLARWLLKVIFIYIPLTIAALCVLLYILTRIVWATNTIGLIGILIILFLLYVAAILVVAKRYTRNAIDFIFLAVLGIAATPLISWMIGKSCEREDDAKYKRYSDEDDVL